jgi:hypothetical protein
MATKKELPAFMLKGKPGDKKKAAGKKPNPFGKMAKPFAKKK